MATCTRYWTNFSNTSPANPVRRSKKSGVDFLLDGEPVTPHPNCRRRNHVPGGRQVTDGPLHPSRTATDPPPTVCIAHFLSSLSSLCAPCPQQSILPIETTGKTDGLHRPRWGVTPAQPRKGASQIFVCTARAAGKPAISDTVLRHPSPKSLFLLYLRPFLSGSPVRKAICLPGKIGGWGARVATKKEGDTPPLFSPISRKRRCGWRRLPGRRPPGR